LAELPAKQFEDFFLHFLNAGVSLTIERHGRLLTRKVISATSYAGEGKDQRGIDLVARVDGGEEWCFQCKRHRKWNRAQTLAAIQKAKRYQAHHFFLVVACNPPAEVHDEMRQHPDWTLWNLDKICAEFRLRVPTTAQPKCLPFLDPSENKRFVPFSTEALVSPPEFFSRFLGSEKLFRHNWKLVGREEEMRSLDQFVQDEHGKVLLLVSKGGDGKSRLLWEFTRDIQDRIPGVQALFCNPQSRDDPAFAFLTDANKRIAVVDDAHRVEQVPLDLLSLVREDPAAKAVLATRPQGVEALVQKLFEAGLQNDYRVRPLTRLKKPETQALAAEALGDGEAHHAQALADIADHCPFLVVLAGDLLRQGSLRWGQWAGQPDFRQHVFRAFEGENLRHLAKEDRTPARGILRLIAMLAPVPYPNDFIEKAGRCLEYSALEVETQLQRLRVAEVVMGRSDGLRIVPDLFADFLVYDTCYEPASKLPCFARRVLLEFPECGLAALRNLAEAAWVAQADGLTDDTLIAPLVTAEMRRFEESSFLDRVTFLARWSTFAVYLPHQSLAVARMAIAQETAPRRARWIAAERFDSHRSVLEALPPLLRPIALYHESHRHEALDLLWELGFRLERSIFGGDQNHPFGVIAEVIRFHRNKPVAVTVSALRWLGGLLENADALKALEGPAPILRTLLEPCFSRGVEVHDMERNIIRWWTQPVIAERTRPAREQALAILRGVIQQGSWLAALDALAALEVAISDARRMPSESEKEADGQRDDWHAEDRRAVDLYQHAISCHNHLVVRFEIRQTLRRALAYDEEPRFISDCRQVLASVPVDLPLRVATALLSHGFFEFEGEAASPQERLENGKAAWPGLLREIAVELAGTHTSPQSLAAFLGGLAGDFTLAGYHPTFGPLLGELVKANPALAAGLARVVIEAGAFVSLAREFPVLIDQNPALTDSDRFFLLAKAARSSITGAAAAAIGFLAWKAEQADRVPSVQEAELLVELAAKPDGEVAARLLDFCYHAAESSLPLVCRILEVLPISQLPPEVVKAVWEVLVPFRKRKASLPKSVVDRLLEQLVAVSRLDLNEHWQQFHEQAQSMPRKIYRLLHNRLVHASTLQAPTEFEPLPQGYDFAFGLAGLRTEPDYTAICDELWQWVLSPQEPHRYAWIRLWQAVVLEDAAAWLPRILAEMVGVRSPDDLERLAELLRFDGSVVVLRFPEVARAFLQRADVLGGDEAVRKMRFALYNITGPAVRSYSSGIIEKKQDYVEAEAIRAAESHVADPVLGPFYRWIVAREQQDRAQHRARNEAYLASRE